MDLTHRIVNEELVSTFDVESYHIDALLFQTGYLTITGEQQRGSRTRYRLDYPNHEVELSLNQGLLRHVTEDPDAEDTGEQTAEYWRCPILMGLRKHSGPTCRAFRTRGMIGPT